MIRDVLGRLTGCSIQFSQFVLLSCTLVKVRKGGGTKEKKDRRMIFSGPSTPSAGIEQVEL